MLWIFVLWMPCTIRHVALTFALENWSHINMLLTAPPTKQRDYGKEGLKTLLKTQHFWKLLVLSRKMMRRSQWMTWQKENGRISPKFRGTSLISVNICSEGRFARIVEYSAIFDFWTTDFLDISHFLTDFQVISLSFETALKRARTFAKKAWTVKRAGIFVKKGWNLKLSMATDIIFSFSWYLFLRSTVLLRCKN